MACDLAGDYTEMVDAFRRRGIFDRRGLERLGSVLDIEYVLQPGLGDFRKTLTSELIEDSP